MLTTKIYNKHLKTHKQTNKHIDKCNVKHVSENTHYRKTMALSLNVHKWLAALPEAECGGGLLVVVSSSFLIWVRRGASLDP